MISFKKKELIAILIIFVILTISVSIVASWTVFLLTSLAIAIAISINTLAKKLIAYYLDSDIEIKIWGIKRFGFKPNKEFKKPFPAGIFFPIIISAATFGNAMWLAGLVFDVRTKKHRAAKRHGLYSYSDITEYQIGLIAAAGIAANLLLAILGYFAGWEILTRISVWYAFFNILPLSDLDGNKIFFGNLVMWSFLATITIIAVAYAFILV